MMIVDDDCNVWSLNAKEDTEDDTKWIAFKQLCKNQEIKVCRLTFSCAT